jgi:hypothetical protein
MSSSVWTRAFVATRSAAADATLSRLPPAIAIADHTRRIGRAVAVAHHRADTVCRMRCVRVALIAGIALSCKSSTTPEPSRSPPPPPPAVTSGIRIGAPLTLGRHSISEANDVEPIEQAPDIVGALADGTMLSSGPWPHGGRVRRWPAAPRDSSLLATDKDMAIAVTPSGTLFAVNETRAPDGIDIYRADGAKSAHVAPGLYPAHAAFSSDDHYLAIVTEGDSSIVRVDLQTGDVTTVRKGSESDVIQRVAIAAGGALVASGGAKVRLHATDGGATRELPETFLNVARLAFIDGDTLLVITESHGIQLWNTTTTTLERTVYEGDAGRPQGASNRAYAAAVDDTLLITGHGDGELRAWDLGTGALITSTRADTTMIWDLDLDLASGRMITLDRQGTVRSWPLVGARR